MSATVTPITAKAKAASIRTQALLLAEMNEEKAGYCDKQQAGFREFLLMNAALLRKVARLARPSLLPRTEMTHMKDPEKLRALADRIDHEQLWRLSGLDQMALPQEQRDRLDAAVNLRRYADDRFTVLKALEEGREYIRGYKLTRPDDMSTDRRGCGTREWHAVLNGKDIGEQAVHWMYTAKLVADEVPRMILLFESERRGLATHYKMCGHDPRPATPLPDNHLTCALGKQCRKCPFLARIEEHEQMTNEAKDEAKAWTCATHILLESKIDRYFESFLRDKSDDAFDARLAESFGY